MDTQNWTTRWDVLRDMMGTPKSKRRYAVNQFLQTRPCLMYWGDSWFSTPLYLNLAKQSMLRVDGMGMILGKPGATAAGLFTPAKVRSIAGWLKAYPFDALLLSAGGNDELSERLEGMFAPWMKKNPPAKLTPQDAFLRVMGSKTLARVYDRYVGVMDGLAPVFKANPNFRVVGQTYALLEQIGQPANLTVSNIGLIAWVKDDVGPWLWPTMQRVLNTKADGKVFSHLLLRDGFRDNVLIPLRNQYAGRFDFADFTSVTQSQQPSFWNDEIHPTQAGFVVLAKVLNQKLRSQLPAAKQAAVT